MSSTSLAFDPVDASAVAEVARWARDRRVRVIVLGDSFCLTRPPLSPIAERVEIVGYVRGVSEVLAADDLPHLDELIEAAGLEVGVTWLTDTPLLVRHGSDRGSVVPSPIRAMA